MKWTLRSLSSLIIAAAMLCSSAISVCAQDIELPFVPIDGGKKTEHLHSDKIPNNLYKIMDKASDDTLIGQSSDPNEPHKLVMYLDVPTDQDTEEHWYEWSYVKGILKDAGVSIKQVEYTGELYAFLPYDSAEIGGKLPLDDGEWEKYESPDDPCNGFRIWNSENGDYEMPLNSVPVVPDGSKFFDYRNDDSARDLSSIGRGCVNAALTKAQINKLCENDSVICFAYEPTENSTFYTFRYMHFTADDAVRILRTSLGLEGKSTFTDDDYPQALRTDIDHNKVADTTDALLALRDSVDLGSVIYWDMERDGTYRYGRQYFWLPQEPKAPEPAPLTFYSVGRKEAIKLKSAEQIAQEGDVIVSALITDRSIIPYSDSMEGLLDGLSMTTGDEYARLFTKYDFKVINTYKTSSDAPSLSADQNSFVIFGGFSFVNNYNLTNEEKELVKSEREIAGGKRIPIDTERFASRIDDELLLILKYDAQSEMWTLNDTINNGYDLYFKNEIDSDEYYTPVDASDIIKACKKLQATD